MKWSGSRGPVKVRALVAPLVVVVVVLASLVGPSGAEAASSIHTCTLTPAQAGSLRLTLASMSVATCSTLELAPGTYDVGATVTDVRLQAGTADTRLTVTAADPAHPPLISGGLYLADAAYWVFDGLRFRGTTENNIPGQSVRGIAPLELDAPTHTVVVHSEFFSTRGFQVATLLAVTSYTDPTTGAVSYPAANSINANCFHDASKLIGDEDPNHDHLLYFGTNYPRSVPAPAQSTMNHNIFYNAVNGAAVKIDQPDVDAFYNTFVHVSDAITVQPTPETEDPPYVYTHSAPLQDIFIAHNLTAGIVPTINAAHQVGQDRAFFVRNLDANPNPDVTQVSIVNNQTWNHKKPFLYVYRYDSSLDQFRAIDPRSHTKQLRPAFSKVHGCGPTFYRSTNPALKNVGRYAG